MTDDEHRAIHERLNGVESKLTELITQSAILQKTVADLAEIVRAHERSIHGNGTIADPGIMGILRELSESAKKRGRMEWAFYGVSIVIVVNFILQLVKNHANLLGPP